MRPKMLVWVLLPLHESQVKQGEIIGKLIHDILFIVTESIVGSYKLAVFQVFQHFSE